MVNVEYMTQVYESISKKLCIFAWIRWNDIYTYAIKKFENWDETSLTYIKFRENNHEKHEQKISISCWDNFSIS